MDLRSAPAIDEIEVSLFGPGYGECLVIHLGGGDWLIVDSCQNQKRQPVALDYLGVLGVHPAQNVRLIVATHWHDDHVRGLNKVFSAASIADFVVSAAMSSKEFLALVGAMQQGRAMMEDTGVSEWSEILKTLLERQANNLPYYKPPVFARSEQRIFQRQSNASNGTQGCEVWALSPSDESYQQAVGALAKLFPQPNSGKGRVPSLAQNHTSVVLWIQFGDIRVLLGADLEDTTSPHSGWNVIAESTKRPSGMASVFKVPHHGSANGNNEKVWQKMLIQHPIGILTPFAHGKQALPTPQDICRLRAATSHSYITASPGLPRNKRNTQGALGKTIADVARFIHDVPMSPGHIRLRAKSGGSWRIECFGSAQKLEGPKV